MMTIAPISSLFNFLNFYLLIALFNADETLFRMGWFVESITTQVMVIFTRTRHNPFHSHPNRWLTITSLGVVAIAMLLPFSPFAYFLGFMALPPLFFGLLTGLIAAYLLTVEYCKQWFYKRLYKHQDK